MVQTTKLDNGITIVTEVVEQVYSASVGVWINVGSEDETADNNGTSHCLEHMLFKGTKQRTAAEIAQEIEDAGGSLGASTGKENTCFYGRVIGEKLPVALDLILDMLLNASLETDDLELERQVILEEIKMYEDDPEDYAHETMILNIWPGHALSRPITGTFQTVSEINQTMLRKHVRDFYTPEKILISIAGNFDETHAIQQIKTHLKDMKPGSQQKSDQTPHMVPFNVVKHKDIEQAHISLVTKGLHIIDPRRYEIAVLDLCLGGNMSSRLFQEVREKRGLAYSINTFRESHRQTGIMGIYAGASPKNVGQVLKLVSHEIERVKKEGFSEREILRAKSQLKSELLLGLESMRNRSARNAYSELFYGRLLTVEEICEDIDRVTTNNVTNLVQELFDPQMFSLVVVGPTAALEKRYSVAC